MEVIMENNWMRTGWLVASEGMKLPKITQCLDVNGFTWVEIGYYAWHEADYLSDWDDESKPQHSILTGEQL